MKSFFGIFLFLVCVLIEGYAQDNKPRYVQLKPIEVVSLRSTFDPTAQTPAAATNGMIPVADGSYNVQWKSLSDLLTVGVSVLPVVNGGTGKSSVTSKALLLGNGTSALTEITKPTATSTQVLVASSTLDPSWGATVAMSGDVSIDINGITTVSGISGKSISGPLASGNILKYDGTNWVPSDPTSFYTFSNGLTSSAGTVKLGGTLTGNTALTLGNYDLKFDATGGSGNFFIYTGTGNFTVYSTNGKKFQISPDGSGYFSSTLNVDGDLKASSNLQVGSPAVNRITVNGGDLTVADDVEVDGDLWVDGNFNGVSDERLKTNIETLSGVLDKINQIRGVSFVFKDQTKYATGSQIGVIAQEIQKVFPELVHLGADGFYGVDYPHLTAVLLQAVKEQQTQMGSLQEKVQKQESRLSELQIQIDELKNLMKK